MLQASLLDGLALDPFAFGEDGVPAVEVDIGGRQVAEALVSQGGPIAEEKLREANAAIARLVRS